MKSSPRPFSPIVVGLSGVVIGLCFVVLGYAFVRDISPREMFGGAPEHRMLGTQIMQPAVPTSMASSAHPVPSPSDDAMRRPDVMMGTQMASDTPATTSVSANPTRLAGRMYRDMPFRFIKIINDAPGGTYTYLVATDRAMIDPSGRSKDNNDELCGSVYTEKTCYLFREGRYTVEADPTPTLLSTWDGPGAFGPDTAVKFVKQATTTLMQFTTSDGDAGCSISATHQINLTTGEHKITKETHSCDTNPNDY